MIEQLKVTPQNDFFLDYVYRELERSRSLYPRWPESVKFGIAVIMEELGELQKILNIVLFSQEEHDMAKLRAQYTDEAIHVLAAIIRFIQNQTKGDPRYTQDIIFAMIDGKSREMDQNGVPGMDRLSLVLSAIQSIISIVQVDTLLKQQDNAIYGTQILSLAKHAGGLIIHFLRWHGDPYIFQGPAPVIP